MNFKKIVYHEELIGVLNFNLMIPVEDALIQNIYQVRNLQPGNNAWILKEWK